MITKNINGNNISSGFVSQVRSDSPNVIARLWYNDSELLCDIVDITVEKGSCGQTTFMIGDVIGDILTATVKDLSTDIKGELIECHIGALVNGSYEYISLGRFRVSEVKKTRYESQITAYSSIVADTGTRLDVTGLNNPTIAQLALRVAGKLGCTVTFDTGINTSYQVGAQLDGLTYYQVLQIIAICCGGYVVNTNDGNVVVHKFNTTTNLNVDTGMMVKLPEIAEKPYTVDSVGVMVAEATTDNNGNPVDEIFYSDNPDYIIVTKQGTDYYLKARSGQLILANLKPESADIYFSCPYMTEDIFKTNIKGIKGYEYYPAQIGLTLGDPRLEGCDVLNVTDVDGNTYAVPCHKVVHKYTGGFTSVITSCEASDNANSIGTSFPITQRFETQARQIGTAQATADNAYKIAGDTNQYFWFTGSGSDTGAHITETPQAQFVADPQNGGGNLLARSNGVAIRDGLTELATFGAYGANINENGVSIANFGSTARVGAEDSSRFLMNAGSLEAYDNENSKYFEVSPDGMTFGDNSVASQQYVDDAEQDAIDTASADATEKANQAEANAIATASADATEKANEAKKTATNYMYFNASTGLNIASADPATATRKVNISADGVKLQENASNYAMVSSSGLNVVQSNASVAEFGSSVRIGTLLGGHVTIDDSALKAYRGTDDFFVATTGGITYLPSSSAGRFAVTQDGNTANLVISDASAKGSSYQTANASNGSVAFGGEVRFLNSGSLAYLLTEANGAYSFAHGKGAVAGGAQATASGLGTIANGESQTATGTYNVADTTSLLLIGNGTLASRSNALQVDSSGNLRINGNLYTNCDADSSNGTLMTMLKVTKSSVSSLSTTITNSAITADMEVVHTVLSNPSAQTGDWTVTTSAGSAVISGTISGTTNITLYLAEPST